MTYIPQSLPDDSIDIMAGRYEAEMISKALYAAYWLAGREDVTALFLLAQAHEQFAQMADAMGYDICRKQDRTAAIAALKVQWETVCGAMNKGTWPGSEADALAEIERIKGEIADLEVVA